MIYIIVPVFNRLAFTKACLNSLLTQTELNFTVIVVDHGSTDGTSEMIATDFPQIVLLNGNEKMWWSAATNLGVQKALDLSIANDDFILTLNNDLEVGEVYLAELLAAYYQHKPCLVGSLCVDICNPNKISFAGGTWNKYTAKYKAHKDRYYYEQLTANRQYLESDLLPGRGVLIPMKAFHDLGLYDEVRFPHYSADDDFSLRCKNNGYRLIVSSKAIVMSHLNANGLSTLQKDTLLSGQRIALSSIKSPVKLATRYAWARKNTPFPLLYFAFDVTRIIGSSFLKSLLNR